MAHPDVVPTDYTSASSADTTSFGNGLANNPQPARWIQVYGSGNVVVLDNSATPVSKTYTFTGGEVLTGEWTAFTSTTCSRVRMGSSLPPPSSTPTTVLPVNLAGGSAVVTNILPAGNVQDWANANTIFTIAFTPAMNTQSPFNFQNTANINFPKITLALDGQAVALVNLGTGATASTLVPSGTDSMGAVANGVTAATAAGPKSLVAQRYVANVFVGQWIPAI